MASAVGSLREAANEQQTLIALDGQLRAALAAARAQPMPREEIPPWLWNAAWARDAITAEIARPDTFSAWRLGSWAKLLPIEERAAALDRAIDAFEKLIPTRIGPGNDSGPFCEIAELLSLEQTRRALSIVERMRAADWGEEARNARAALAARLVVLGRADETAPVSAPVSDRQTCVREWNAWLSESLEHGLLQRLTDPRCARLLRALAGQPVVDLCRELLVGWKLDEAIERRIAEYVADPDPRISWVKPVVQEERFLPLYLGWVAVLGIRPDGTFVRWDHEVEPKRFATLDEPCWQRLAACEGARKYPELTRLIPPRPETAITCDTCRGAGRFEARPDLICACHGVGWLLPGEPQPNHPG